MIDNNVHDTLLLVVNEKEGIVSEYQRQLYEASLLGIDRVLYCLVCDSNKDNKHNRMKETIEKLEMTCNILKMQRLNKTFTVWDSFISGSRVIKTNDDGFIIPSIACGECFDNYKENHKNMLQIRERIGKIIVKSIA